MADKTLKEKAKKHGRHLSDVLTIVAFIAVVIWLALLAPGCSQQEPDYKARVAAEVAITSVEVIGDLRPSAGDVCPDCNGRGKVGDGRTMVECKACCGTGRVGGCDEEGSQGDPPPQLGRTLSPEVPAIHLYPSYRDVYYFVLHTGNTAALVFYRDSVDIDSTVSYLEERYDMVGAADISEASDDMVSHFGLDEVEGVACYVLFRYNGAVKSRETSVESRMGG